MQLEMDSFLHVYAQLDQSSICLHLFVKTIKLSEYYYS